MSMQIADAARGGRSRASEPLPAGALRGAVAATAAAAGSPRRLRDLRAEILAVYAELSAALLAGGRRKR
jgi:hypothetical protein